MSRNRHFRNGYSNFGENYAENPAGAKGHDVTMYGDSSGAYAKWDASANKLQIVGVLDIDPLSGVEGINVGANANTDGSGIALTRASLTAGVRFYADDGGAALTGTGSVPDLRGALSRMLITQDNTGGDIRVHGLMGQLKSYDGFWNDEVVSAVHGRLEIVRSAETVVLGGYGISAAVLGIPATSGTITVDTNHVLAGVAALADFRATLTQTGITAGMYVGKYNTSQWSDSTTRYNWKYGIYVDEDSVDYCPIAVGKFVASAASGGGFAVTSTNSAAMRVYAEVTADLTSAAAVRSILGRMLVTGNFTSTAECFGTVGQVVVKNAKMQHDNAGVMGTFEVQTTAATVSGDIGNSVCSAVLGRVGVTITGTTIEADGVLAGIASMSNITDGYVSITGAGVLAGLYINKFSGKQDWKYGIYMDGTERVLYAGSSSDPITCDTASTVFYQQYTDCGALSGTSQGMYVRHYVTGAGGSGQALRAYGTVSDVIATDARGAHISLSFGATGTVTGSGQALTTTLHIADQATQTGNLSAITVEIYADGDTSDPAGSTLSCIRFSNGGGAGKADIDDDCALFHIDTGFTDGTGNMIYTHNPGNTFSGSIKVRIGGATKWIYYADSE